MDKDDVGHSSNFTVITGAVDDPRITETTPTHKKASHATSLAAKYEPGRAKAFAVYTVPNLVLIQYIWQDFVMQTEIQ